MAKPKAPKEISITREERVHIRLALEDREVDYVVDVGSDGLPRIYTAPQPSAPVQDPDPISGT